MKTLRTQIEELLDKTGKHYMAKGRDYRADKPDSLIVDQIIELIEKEVILPERIPLPDDKAGELLCAGFNDYRDELRSKLDPKE